LHTILQRVLLHKITSIFKVNIHKVNQLISYCLDLVNYISYLKYEDV
jgi:hypothetical protein